MHFRFSALASISKRDGRRAKGSEIWASGVSLQCIQGPFDSYVLEVFLVSFGAFLIFDKFCISKTAGRRAKRIENLGLPGEHSLCF